VGDEAAEAAGDTGSDDGDALDPGATSTAEDATRVLEFRLANEQYCLDIRYIEEIVKQEQITTILNPKVTIGKDDTEAGDLVVVFDGESFQDADVRGDGASNLRTDAGIETPRSGDRSERGAWSVSDPGGNS
jgi:purine-binding chemotaxis protein CheW